MQERISGIPRGRRIAVPCAGGYRSSIATSILHQYGITNLIEMAGIHRSHSVNTHRKPKWLIQNPGRKTRSLDRSGNQAVDVCHAIVKVDAEELSA
jgi:hypothetical protein